MPQTNLYVVGVKGSGVLFVRTNPFRVVVVSDESIQAYNDANPGRDGYGRIAAAARKLIAASDSSSDVIVDDAMESVVESSVNSGMRMSDVDFAFFSPVDDSDWYSGRMVFHPLNKVLREMDPSAKHGSLGTQQLSSAVMSDKPADPVPDWTLPEENVA